MQLKELIQALNFIPKENTSNIFIKKYTSGYTIEIDLQQKLINYGDEITLENKTAQNLSQAEDWVVLECVNRLLEKGYAPNNIILEKTWPSGHGTSGRLDICLTHNNGSEFLLIECKTWGKEFTKAFNRLKKDGGQLFTYFKFSNKANVLMLYSSKLDKQKITYCNEIIKIEEAYRIGDVKDFYSKWNKLTKNNGIFEPWVPHYQFKSRALTPNDLDDIKQEDSGFIFNRFLEILRHNVVSDKPNAFNKIFTLFLCKIYDEKVTPPHKELKFQWLEGIDDNTSFQMRLTDLYKNGMDEFLDKQVTDFSDEDFETKYKNLDEGIKRDLRNDIIKLRLEKNNEFAIKEVFDNKSFTENAKVVKEVVELLQAYKLRYTKKQQYLSDFFELLLTTGLKQEAGQFFTPVPIAQFIVKSMPLNELVDQKLTAGKRDDLLPYVIDYAAGSGHFLTEVMHEIQRILDNKTPTIYIPDTAKKIKTWQVDHFDWAFQYIYGVEKDYRLVKVGKVGCYLHGDGLANVIHSDGLASFTQTEEYTAKLTLTDKDFIKENKQFDIVVSNPPYSVQAFKQNARDYYTEKDFDLYSALTDNSSEIECLFIERTKQLLKDGGLAGIILPSSILSNRGIYTKAREVILQYFDIIAIAELGSNTFMATGTNTVTLFLRRKNNYHSLHLKQAVQQFFKSLQDVTLNGIEDPIKKYITYVWDDILFEDYITLVQKQPNQSIQAHDIYQDYQKKIKAKTQQEKWEQLLSIEAEKIYYFIIAYPQKVVLVKSGQKTAEKQFLGYEFSNRRGSEGIHPIKRGKSIDECTKLFDADIFDNPQKASTYIYKAFNGDFEFPIHNSLQKNIHRANLVDMLVFNWGEFEKNISLTAKKKVKIESKWALVRLGDVSQIFSGGTPNTGNEEYWNGDFNWATLVDTKNKYLYSTQRKITKKGIEKSSATLLPINTVIFSSRATIGDVSIAKVETCTNQGYKNFVCDDEKINFEYLYYILKRYSDNIASLASGMTYPEISKSLISDFKIPLPPKEVQEKIVADMALLEQKEQETIDKITNLKEEINKIYLLSKRNFDEVVLSKEIEIISGGTPNTNKPEYWHGDIPWLSIVDFKGENRFVETTQKTITETGLKNSSTKYLEKGDIIISARGTVGALAQLKKSMTFNQSCYGLKTNKNLNSDYLYFALKFEIEQFKDNAYGAIFDTITTKTFDLIKIPLPPLSEQQKIVSNIEKIEQQIDQLQQVLNSLPQKKDAILKQYLT